MKKIEYKIPSNEFVDDIKEIWKHKKMCKKNKLKRVIEWNICQLELE